MISHQAFCTSVAAHGSATDLDSSSRVLHLSTYTFDHTLFEFFTTLLQGGCICTPSESERLSDLAGYISRKQVNWAFLTATIATTITPSEVPTLKTLVLGGELIPQHIIDDWSHRTELIVGYGPTECSICLLGRLSQDSKTGDIGTPTACCA